MNTVLEYISKIPKTFITVFGVLFVVILGIVDHLTGYEISFSIFYLLPIAIISWFVGKLPGVTISVLSSITWLLADLTSGHIYSQFVIPLWNSIMRLGFFLVVTFSVSTIKKLLQKEKELARLDFLTGVANSRAFYELAGIEINKAIRTKRPFTFAYIDIDNFKQVNDTLGHSAGDKLLYSVAETIKLNVRSIDIVSRLGGDEFAILMPETEGKQAEIAVNRVQKYLLEIVQQNKWPVTFSIGVVTCYEPCKMDELVKEADNLMYSAKENGKNSVKYKIHGKPATVT